MLLCAAVVGKDCRGRQVLARCVSRTNPVFDFLANGNVMTKPDTTLALMEQLSDDFHFAPKLSTASRLLFVQTGTSAVAWAFMAGDLDVIAAAGQPAAGV